MQVYKFPFEEIYTRLARCWSSVKQPGFTCLSQTIADLPSYVRCRRTLVINNIQYLELFLHAQMQKHHDSECVLQYFGRGGKYIPNLTFECMKNRALPVPEDRRRNTIFLP